MSKVALTILAVVLLPFAAHATYQTTMHSMGLDFRALTVEAQTGAFAADALGLAQDLEVQVKIVQGETPDSTVLDPADPAFATKKADMDRMINIVLTQTQSLIAALKNGDQASALQIVNDMIATRKQGHDTYRPAN